MSNAILFPNYAFSNIPLVPPLSTLPRMNPPSRHILERASLHTTTEHASKKLWHAFLMYVGLPHGEELLQDDARCLKELLSACRSLKMFGALCNRWLMVEQLREQRERAGGSVDGNSGVHNLSPSTLKKENRNHGSNHNGTDTCVRFYFSKGFAFSGTKRAPFSFFSIRHSI